jgi:hypothetical protein
VKTGSRYAISDKALTEISPLLDDAIDTLLRAAEELQALNADVV